MNKYTILLIVLSFMGILEAKEDLNKGKETSKTKKNVEKVDKKPSKLLKNKKDIIEKSLVPIPVTEDKNDDTDVVIDLN